MRCRVAMLVAFAACGPSHKSVDAGGGGDDDAPIGSDAIDYDATPCGQLTVTLRDFQISHPDFEDGTGDDRGIIAADLGADNLPVYAHAGATSTVSSKASFDQWYRDTPGVNMTFQQPLPLTEGPPGTFVFDDQDFFPLDNVGWGNEGNPHNFHFTSEIHGTFTYHGGEIFQFIGDDDVFVFVNKKFALDLGGVHGPEMQSVDFNASAAALGISIGGTYRLDVFHAERHTVQSTFRMVTTIDCFIIQ